MNPYGSMDMYLGAIALKPFVWVEGQLWQRVDRSLTFVWRKNGGVWRRRSWWTWRRRLRVGRIFRWWCCWRFGRRGRWIEWQWFGWGKFWWDGTCGRGDACWTRQRSGKRCTDRSVQVEEDSCQWTLFCNFFSRVWCFAWMMVELGAFKNNIKVVFAKKCCVLGVKQTKYKPKRAWTHVGS